MPYFEVTIQGVKLAGFPVKADLRDSIRFSPCLRTVEMELLITHYRFAPSSLRKQPETFCSTLIMGKKAFAVGGGHHFFAVGAGLIRRLVSSLTGR